MREARVVAVEAEPWTDEPAEPRNEATGIPFRNLFREMWAGCWAWEEWTAGDWLRLAGVFCLAALCSWVGIILARQSEGVATIWFSNGLVLGLLLTQSPRRWLPYFAAGLLADTVADRVYGDRWAVAIGVSLANSLEVVLSAVVLTRLFGAPLDLSKRRPLVGFLLVAVVGATALTSVLGATWTGITLGAGSWWVTFRTWWLGDMLGMAVLVPLTVMLQRPQAYALLRPRALGSTLLVLLVPVLATVLVFTHDQDPLIFLLFPALLLVAFRLGFPGTVLTIVLVTAMAIGLTVTGHGPLMLITGPQVLAHRIVVAQVFAAVSIFTMFPVAALLEEREALKGSLAVSEARHRRLSQTDELTGLANRRAFNRRLAADWEEAALYGGWVGLLLVDADHFKQYNDGFGHLEGDACLQRLAEILLEVMDGRAGVTARYGGEEFAVLLPGADGSAARAAGEALRAAIAAERLPHPTEPGGILTVSVGVAAVRPGPEDGTAVLVKRADEALYCAKLGGRDQVAML